MRKYSKRRFYVGADTLDVFGVNRMKQLEQIIVDIFNNCVVIDCDCNCVHSSLGTCTNSRIRMCNIKNEVICAGKVVEVCKT